MRRTFLTLFLLTVITAQAFAQTASISADERRMAEQITADRLSNWLHFVASDAMGGRNTPSQGLDITAEFLKMNLQSWGFKGAGDNGTFFQKMAMSRRGIDNAATTVMIGDLKFNFGTDIIRVSGSTSEPLNAPVVFVGNGWMIKSKGMNPYAGIDIKGKIIAVYSDGLASNRAPIPLPAGVTQADIPTAARGTEWSDPVSYARANGAAGVIILPNKSQADNWSQLTSGTAQPPLVMDKLRQVVSPNIFLASPKFAEALVVGEQGNPLTGYTTPFALRPQKAVTINLVDKVIETQWTQNVVALWEGGDPVLKNEMVAIGAHYDHVGTNPNAPGEDKIWNGADDDGSGTVAVLAIAEALAKQKTRPKRSVLLVWHAGEEKGLLGAEYFNKFPTVDIRKVVAQLNIDMIGRSQNPNNIIKCTPQVRRCNEELSKANEIYVIGKDMMSSTLGAIVDSTNAGYHNLAYNTKYDDPKDPNRFFFRSDHFHYAQNGIPIAFWFDGVHEDYHQPSDTADKIDYQKMEKVTRTIFLTMWELSELKERPKIDKQLPPELSVRNP